MLKPSSAKYCSIVNIISAIVFLSSIFLVNANEDENIALNVLKNYKISVSNRFRRQIELSQQANQLLTRSPSPAEVASVAGANANQQDPNASGSANNQQDEKELEILNSIKCDFGSADSPDLCKFKIVDFDANNPLGKSLTSWSHGSGKLALYQGGPLIDASDRNDTNGGYIFYETSNPYAPGASTPSQNLTSTQSQPYHQPASSPYSQNDPYSSISMALQGNKHNHQKPEANQMLHSNDQFQHVTSGRISINANTINNQNILGPSFVSPNLTAPGPSGMCLSFRYAIQGLSAEELRIYVNDHKTERSRQIWSSSESAGSNWTKGEVLYSVTNMHSLMFAAGNSANSMSSMSTKDPQQRKFRGFLALDEIEVNKHDSGASEACKGHCNYDGDLCGWTNAENGQEDDFDWSFGRGSDNLFTGPARDYISSTNNDLTGSFLYTDSGYPRRPGDKAVLLSPMFQPTAVNEAMCMRFAVHMFGSGIGSLAIKLRYADAEAVVGPGGANGGQGASPNSPSNAGQPGAAGPNGPASAKSSVTSSSGDKANDLIIWEMSGDAGNNWHQAQTSVSSAKSAFQVVIEGTIGENHLGNIALDEISFSQGPCPTSPPVASKNYGDCTFEQSMCYWRNPDAEIHLDDLDWIRLIADEPNIHGPNFDHTLKKRQGSYLKLENTFREPKSGSRAFLLSPIFQPKAQGNVQCLSFYYYMFMRSISSQGPNLGTIRVYLASNNELVPIWRLTNPISSPNWKHARASLSTALVDGQPTAPSKLFQIAFEGIWGDAAGGAIAIDDITVFDGACDIMPPEAKSVPGECTFDVDMCSWSNKTSDLMMSHDNLNSIDASRSPFLQSVSNQPSSTSSKLLMMNNKKLSWQLATIDARPVNLQDHTYKAPIGYVYIDVLDNHQQQHQGQRLSYILQSHEVTVQQGQQQVVQCLSFWFAAFGRQDSNLLNVHLTQASAPPAPAEDGGGQPASVTSKPISNQAGVNQAAGQPSGSAAESLAEQENANAWKLIEGKLLWSVALKNVTELGRRKWQYGQVTLKADSNYIVRFVALSTDGGFALDDVSYYEGACETRPFHAKIFSEDDEATSVGGGSGPSSVPSSSQPSNTQAGNSQAKPTTVT